MNNSDTSTEITELDVLLEEICEKENTADENMKGDDANRKKIEADRANADEARLKAMERVGETKKRQRNQGADREVKKKRRSGNETLDYLREKSEIERNIRERELYRY